MEQQELNLDRESFCCPICLDLLNDPVTLPCTDSYCMNCIKTRWDEEEEEEEEEKELYSCPECRQTFTPRPVLVRSTMLVYFLEELKRLEPGYAAPEDEIMMVYTEPNTRDEFLKLSREITLNPNTAYLYLLLSDGNRKATLMATNQFKSYPPERFIHWPQVMSRESLTGRCYWEVEWGGLGGVDVAVTYMNICRYEEEEEGKFGFNDKSWMLACNSDGYAFYYNKVHTPVSGPQSSRVGVYLDHRAGILSFYSVSETMTLLHRVQTTFTQPLYAGLNPYYTGDSAEFCKLK